MKPAGMAIWFPSWFGRTEGWNRGSGIRSAASFKKEGISLPDLVAQVSFVFVADKLDQLRVGNQLRMQFGFPCFGIRLWVVHDELDVHVPHVAAVNSFGQMHGIGHGNAAAGHPRLPV